MYWWWHGCRLSDRTLILSCKRTGILINEAVCKHRFFYPKTMHKLRSLLTLTGLLWLPLGLAVAQAQDEWSGDYRATIVEDGKLTPVTRKLKIVLSERYSQKQRRWHSLMDDTKTASSASDAEYNKADYQHWGWSDLRNKSDLRCIGSREFAMCKVKAGTPIPIRRQASYRANSGIFSINENGVINQITRVAVNP